MGKVKRSRTTYHNKPTKSTVEVNEPAIDSILTTRSPYRIPTGSRSHSASLFAGVPVGLDDLRKNIKDFESRSMISTKSLGFQLKKKEKTKLRHEFFMRKMDAVAAAKTEAKNQKKRKATPVVGDMKPLEDALPTLDLLMKESFQRMEKKVEKPRNSKSHKRQQKEMLEDMKAFTEIASNPDFKCDPMGTIANHLRMKLEAEYLESS